MFNDYDQPLRESAWNCVKQLKQGIQVL